MPSLTPAPGQLTFPILQRLCGPGLAVTDDQALQAMALAFTHLRIVLEPGGAVALAASLFRPRPARHGDLHRIGVAMSMPPPFQTALARFPRLTAPA